ncbi:MAG TPA: DUF6334 family protein, partial [Kamptonema sp.]|nr:DUF6334 family protein [Kamptonema sp.]
MDESQLNLLREMAYEAGELKEVKYLFWMECPYRPEAVVLSFRNRVFTIQAIADDDTIAVTSEPLTISEEQKFVSITQSPPWSRAIGRAIRWVWNLKNQQEYPDGVQLSFANPDSEEEIIIQLVTVASFLNIYSVEEMQNISYEHIRELQKLPHNLAALEAEEAVMNSSKP